MLNNNVRVRTLRECHKQVTMILEALIIVKQVKVKTSM